MANAANVSFRLLVYLAGDEMFKSDKKTLPKVNLVMFVLNLILHCCFVNEGMIDKLSMEDSWEDPSFVSAVAKSTFADGTTNWGRVASLLAFGAVVCQYLKENGKKDYVELVAQEISTYLLSNQRDWLIKNNAWVSCGRMTGCHRGLKMVA